MPLEHMMIKSKVMDLPQQNHHERTDNQTVKLLMRMNLREAQALSCLQAGRQATHLRMSGLTQKG